MRKLFIAVYQLLFILSACSSPLAASASIPATTARPTVTAPAPTKETTATPTPEPTKDLRFSELVPETLELCKKNNQIRLGHETEDIALILAKERLLNTNSEKIDPFSIGISNLDPKKYKIPSIIGIISSNKNKTPISSCSYFENEKGKNMYIIGVPLKRNSSNTIGHLHFAIDPEAIVQFYSVQRGYKDLIFNGVNFNMNNNYDKIKTGEYKKMQINLILWRGYAEQGGIWQDLLDLDPQKMNIDSKYVKIINYGIHGSSDKEIEKWASSEIEKIILPAVSIGVIY